MDRDTFAAALKMHRDRLGLTQAEAARLLGVSPRVVWKWEHADGDCLTVTMEGVIARLKFARAETPPTPKHSRSDAGGNATKKT